MAQCPYHEAVNKRVADCEAKAEVVLSKAQTLEGQTEDLYEKHNENVNLYGKIIERLSAIEGNQLLYMSEQKTQTSKIEVFCKEFKEMKFDERIRNLESFDWFRRKMTAFRDNLPWVIITLFAGILLALFFKSDISLLSIFKALGGVK